MVAREVRLVSFWRRKINWQASCGTLAIFECFAGKSPLAEWLCWVESTDSFSHSEIHHIAFKYQGLQPHKQ